MLNLVRDILFSTITVSHTTAILLEILIILFLVLFILIIILFFLTAETLIDEINENSLCYETELS